MLRARMVPTDASTPSRSGRIALVLGVLIPTLALDLWTKAWAWDNLRQQAGKVIVDGFFRLEFAFNTGSAFGFLRDADWARAFFIAVTVGALVYMARLALTLPTRAPSAFVAIGLIAGGALGNLHDRFIRTFLDHHGVVDFIVVNYWPGKRWPAFNIADAALVAGVLLFMIYLRRHGDQADVPALAPPAA